MPLPEPAPREAIHQRHIDCRGYRRADGLWDIEGELRDSKHYPLQMSERGLLPPGGLVHGLKLRLTIDDDYLIHSVAVASDDTPYAHCKSGVDNYQRLVGLSIGRGWRRALRQHLGGAEGCTHLVELLGNLATAAFQTIFPMQGGHLDDDDSRRPQLLGSCRAFARDSPVVMQRWPRWYRPAAGDTEYDHAQFPNFADTADEAGADIAERRA